MSENNKTSEEQVDLLEKILDERNIQKAYERLYASNGCVGIVVIGIAGLFSKLASKILVRK